MLPVIQSLWIGEPLSQIEKLCVQSYLDHGHTFHLYTYGDVGNIPAGVVVKDANTILPESKIYRSRRGCLANFSDWFRYELLYQKGEFWVDMDTVCIQPFTFDPEAIFAETDLNVVGNTVLGFPQGHELMRKMSYSCKNHHKLMPWHSTKDRLKKIKYVLFRRGKNRSGFGEMGGPEILSNALRYFGLYAQAKPFTYFYPIGFRNWHRAFDHTFANDTETTFFSNTYCVHLWNEMSRRISFFDKNANFPEKSLIEQLKRKHGIQPLPDAPSIENDRFLSVVSRK